MTGVDVIVDVDVDVNVGGWTGKGRLAELCSVHIIHHRVAK